MVFLSGFSLITTEPWSSINGGNYRITILKVLLSNLSLAQDAWLLQRSNEITGDGSKPCYTK